MTAWVIVIRKGNEEHWDIAQEHGYWDMLKSVPIQPGDALYFWQSGGSFVGRAQAGQLRRLTESDEHPWNDREHYTTRVAITATDGRPVKTPRWSEVEALLDRRVSLRGHVPRLEGADESVLAGFFADDDLSRAYRDDERRLELESLGYDMREFDVRAIARRQGQPAFRRELLRAYSHRCAVTGSTTVEVLEAAHIAPFRGQHTNRVDNGLLLRSDVHTLFDLQRLTVLPTLVVSVHPELRSGGYGQFHGERLASVPDDTKLQPGQALLTQHNAQCDWDTAIQQQGRLL
jgi:hypothetical protein